MAVLQHLLVDVVTRIAAKVVIMLVRTVESCLTASLRPLVALLIPPVRRITCKALLLRFDRVHGFVRQRDRCHSLDRVFHVLILVAVVFLVSVSPLAAVLTLALTRRLNGLVARDLDDGVFLLGHLVVS